MIRDRYIIRIILDSIIVIPRILKFREHVDNLGGDILEGKKWSEAYLNLYDSICNSDINGYMDEENKCIIRKNARDRMRTEFYPDMVELHRIMEKVLDLYRI